MLSLSKHLATATLAGMNRLLFGDNLKWLRDTLEDLDDRRELAHAKKRNNGKPGTSWESVKNELGFEF